jgi:general secretion pathway protein M
MAGFSFNTMSERERRMVQFGAIAVVLLLIFGVVLPLDRKVSQAQHRIAQKTTDLAWMRENAPELAAAGPMHVATGESLLAIADRSARESNLGSSIAGSDPSGTGGLRMRLEKAPFDTLVAWLARLSEQTGVRVESATIDSTGTPGTVNAAIVLHTPPE